MPFAARPERHAALRIHAARRTAGRRRAGAGVRRLAAPALRHRRPRGAQAQGRLHLSRPHGGPLARPTHFSRRRRRTPDAAVRRSGHEQRRARRAQSRLETRGGRVRPSRSGAARHLSARTPGPCGRHDAARGPHGSRHDAAQSPPGFATRAFFARSRFIRRRARISPR